MKSVLKPERLCPGDIVGLIAPASAPPDPKSIDRAAAALEKLGYKPKLGKNIRARHGFHRRHGPRARGGMSWRCSPTNA